MKWIKSLFFKYPLLVGILAFVGASIGGLFLTYKDLQLAEVEEKKEIERTAELIESRIQDIISTTHSAASILSYLVETGKMGEEFNLIGESIIDNFEIIESIEYLDSGVVVNTYPLIGNESWIGFDIFESPSRREEAIETIRRKELYFAGPVESDQTNKAIVARLPLFEKNQFQGFAVVLLDWDKFKNEIFSGILTDPNLLIDLIKISTDGNTRVSLLSQNFSGASGPFVEISIPEGNWIIKVQLQTSAIWINYLPILSLRIFTALLFGFLIFRFAEEPNRLSKEVAKKTKELKQSYQLFELASQATADILWDWDIKNNKTYRSKNLETLLGYENNEDIGTDDFWKSIIHPDDLDRVSKKLEDALKNGSEKWVHEFRVRTASGEYLYIIDKGLIIRDESGNPIRVVGSTQDITATKKAELEIATQKQRLSNVIEGTRAGIWEWNTKTEETIINETWANLVGYTLDELSPVTFDTWKNLVHPEDLLNALNEIEKYVNGKTSYYEVVFRMKHKTGHWVWILARGKGFSWTPEGQPITMAGTHVDITENKRKEEEIKLANQRLRSSNEELKSFASVVSHDLKEPLRMISSFLKLLEKKYQDVLDEKGKQYINFAVDGSIRLTKLIEDMLEYARIGFDPTQVECLDLNSLIEELLQLKQDIINEKGAEIHLEKLPKILGIKTPIQSVFMNLVSNSLKYQKKEGIPIISIYSKNLGEISQITVEDNGIGIEKDYFEKVFKLFTRLHSKNQFSGTGIGLAVCKKIISQHGGKIWLESEPGKGSKFHFTLRNYNENAN